MSKIKFELYGGDVETVDFSQDSASLLTLDFSEELEGFVRIGELTERLSGGICDFDLRLLENGDYTPELILEDRRVVLPLIKKFGNIVVCCDCTEGYIRSASQRERALSKRVLALENKIKEIEDKVYGSVII